MGLLKTKMFQTIHPMTYFFVIQSIVWAILAVAHGITKNMNILGIAGQMIFWPEAVTYLWAFLIVATALLMLFFFLRDYDHRPRSRIMLMAKIIVTIWVFAAIVWINLGFWPMVIVSLYNILGFAYIGLAAKTSKFNHRV